MCIGFAAYFCGVFVCIGVICGYCSRWLENELKSFTEQKSSKSFCCDGQVINRVSPVILAGQVFFFVCCLFFTGSKGDVCCLFALVLFKM